MTRQTSKGTCTFCHRELSKASMTRHLQSCEQRIAIQGERGSRQKAKKIKAFHLIVEGYRLPMYWMHLEVAAGTTLATLDRFLRATWLECCGHLSAFEIEDVRYSVDAGMHEWDTGGKSMQVCLEQVLNPGQTCSYEYDFGSTTELLVKVIAECEVEMKGRAIQILARNNPPIVACDVCGEPATSLCPQCIYEDNGCLCDACAKNHACGEEMLMPLVNSPRAGVCGYTGQDPAFIW